MPIAGCGISGMAVCKVMKKSIIVAGLLLVEGLFSEQDIEHKTPLSSQKDFPHVESHVKGHVHNVYNILVQYWS